MTPDLWLLALLWVAWCALHSLLIARGVQRVLQTGLGPRFRFVRLVYNIVAVVTLAVLFVWTRRVGGPVLFNWWGAWIPVGAVLFAAGAALFWAGGRVYDLDALLGVSQLMGAGIGEAGGLTRRGILGAIRHPWYTGGMLLLWAFPRDAAGLVASIVLSAYLVVGAYLEEAKLIAEFGEEYRAYRREVSMFVPFRWVRARFMSRG
jgi:protein-S-isoprenylcysteine O-methyltransferase Ste14